MAYLDDYRDDVKGRQGSDLACAHTLVDGKLIGNQLVICECARCGAQTRQWTTDVYGALMCFTDDLARAVLG